MVSTAQRFSFHHDSDFSGFRQAVCSHSLVCAKINGFNDVNHARSDDPNAVPVSRLLTRSKPGVEVLLLLCLGKILTYALQGAAPQAQTILRTPEVPFKEPYAFIS